MNLGSTVKGQRVCVCVIGSDRLLVSGKSFYPETAEREGEGLREEEEESSRKKEMMIMALEQFTLY